MELGNIVFGNSRGEFPIKRRAGWEDELIRLFDAYAPDRYNEWREYGVNFENNTFSVMEYWWGDCTCGAWCPQHSEDCDITTKRSDWIADRLHWASGEADERGFAEVDLSRIPDYPVPPPECTCGADGAWEEREEHDEDCNLVRPNFLHKPTGFEIQWYKYPLRDSYKNMNITLEQFREIISDCIESL